MDIIEAARQLGAAIQADERFVKLVETRRVNDADAELQELIGQFNTARMTIDNELSKEEGERNEEKINRCNYHLSYDVHCSCRLRFILRQFRCG